MNIHKSKNRLRRALNLESLEQRQLLAVASFGGNIPQDDAGTELRIPWQAQPDSYEFTQPAHGALQWNDSQTDLIYKPDQGFTGADSFTYAADGIQPQEFSIRVWETVFAVPDWQSVTNDVPSRLDVLANDYIFTNDYLEYDERAAFPTWVPENGATTIVDVQGAVHGQIGIADDGRSLRYEAAPDFMGSDTVVYTVADAFGHYSTAEVTIHVTAEPQAGKHFVAEAEFLQSQVDAWMRRYSGALTNHVVFPFWQPTMELDPLVFFNFSLADVSGNDQVSGVQEGDIVRTDGEFLYVVTHSQTPNRFTSFLSIVDVRQPSAPKILSTTGFEEHVEDLFLADNGRIAVVSSNNGFPRNHTPLLLDWPIWPTERDFMVHVLDVAEPVSPQTVWEITLEGEYRESRLIDGFLYTIGSQHGQTLPAPHELIDEVVEPTSPAPYLEALLARGTAAFLPTMTIAAGGTERNEPLLGWSDVIRTDVTWDDATFICTLDLQGSTGVPVDVEAVAVGGFSTVHVSQQAIYLLDGQQVVKLGFEPEGAGVDLVASGALQGRPLNQFSVDEHEGRLRVATMSDGDWGLRRVDVHVFEQDGELLNIVGSLTDIAPGETIYATRFEGDKAFVVTFRTVDPLFVIDLSAPTQPTIAGELKVPGYSNYLQMVGDNLLLGIGRDADEETGLYDALQVSLFDVEDPQDPVLLDRYLFDGGRSTWSPMADSPWQLADHQAVSFDPATGLLTVPIHSNGGWNWLEDPLFVGDNSAVRVLRLSTQGIEEVGQVAFNDRALRSVFLEDHVLYLSGEALQVAALNQPTTVIGALGLPLDGRDLSAGVYDMNGDGVTSPLDALLLINASQDVGFGTMDTVTSAMIQAGRPYMATKLDVNRDGAFSPLDALMIVNQLPSSTPPQAARSVVVGLQPEEEDTDDARSSDETWVPFDLVGFGNHRSLSR